MIRIFLSRFRCGTAGRCTNSAGSYGSGDGLRIPLSGVHNGIDLGDRGSVKYVLDETYAESSR